MHLIESMAYDGVRPWHGRGARLSHGQPVEVWRRESGMDWEIKETEVRYAAGQGEATSLRDFPAQKVLYRSDNKHPLAVVSRKFRVVQPGEVLEFYRDLTACGGFRLETAGVLRGGRKFWAMARTGLATTLEGRDRVEGYLLLATSCDGTLATTAQFTSVRVVCNNTLRIALSGNGGAIKVPHRSEFDAEAVKRQLGVTVSAWDAFVARMRELCEVRVAPTSVDGILRRVLTYPSPAGGPAVVNEQALSGVRALFEGAGAGSRLSSSRGTVWGLLNSVTEYVDHHRRARSDDHRRDAAWFGPGAQLKQRAWEEMVGLL